MVVGMSYQSLTVESQLGYCTEFITASFGPCLHVTDIIEFIMHVHIYRKTIASH